MTVSKSTSVDSNNYSRRCERIYFPAGQTQRIMLDRRTTTSEVSCAATAAVSTGSHAEIMHWDVPPSSRDFNLRLSSAKKQVSSSITKIITWSAILHLDCTLFIPSYHDLPSRDPWGKFVGLHSSNFFVCFASSHRHTWCYEPHKSYQRL